MKDIEKVIDFMVEIEKLKDISRKTMPVGLDRFENSAEHSWHVCISALMLKDYANEKIDIDRVIKMLLIHDLGEIDAGDTIVYASNTAEINAQEEAGIKRILSLLPEKADNQAAEYFALWKEFEAGETADSKYARAIDRVPPLLHNLHGNGLSWKENKVAKEKVFALNGDRISKGSLALWNTIEKKLNEAVKEEILN